MPQIHAHPLEVVAASIATESKPPQTIVAPISIIGETTAPRPRSASHISPLTMLVSFVCGWNSMPASADDDAPGAGGGQDFRGFVSAEGFNYGLSICDGTHRRVILPPPAPTAPMPRRLSRAAPGLRRRPLLPPASPAADYHGHGHHAGRAGRRDMEEPIRLYCEGRNKINSAEAAGFDLRGASPRTDGDGSGVQTPFVRDSRGQETATQRARPQRYSNEPKVP